MFVAQYKNIIESEESSDEEVVSYPRRIINRISSNSDSNDEESYASEDLEMLEELAIAEEEELTNAGDSLDNIQWNEFANKQQSFTFTGKSGLLIDLPSKISPVVQMLSFPKGGSVKSIELIAFKVPSGIFLCFPEKLINFFLEGELDLTASAAVARRFLLGLLVSALLAILHFLISLVETTLHLLSLLTAFKLLKELLEELELS
ncbi:hypothetical protein WN51_14560 [Melipona quadrifasciata]|uniref:Uncharacterized protein n=1 Tax=Melipona quadrifasciata TaxID=166423 RepID=A0A0M8ZZZ4_9HYME|nr:hypothetical protein WN51_14560 [Melipona quadrifasciata]